MSGSGRGPTPHEPPAGGWIAGGAAHPAMTRYRRSDACCVPRFGAIRGRGAMSQGRRWVIVCLSCYEQQQVVAVNPTAVSFDSVLLRDPHLLSTEPKWRQCCCELSWSPSFVTIWPSSSQLLANVSRGHPIVVDDFSQVNQDTIAAWLRHRVEDGSVVVFFASDRVEVSWIHAFGDTAEVVELESFWDRAYQQFVEQAMDLLVLASPEPYSVAAFAQSSRPHPAPSSSVDFDSSVQPYGYIDDRVGVLVRMVAHTMMLAFDSLLEGGWR